MADIQTYLKQILNAVYGKDVRQAIHDAIHKCYEDGSAGEQDLIAREGVEEIKSNIANPNLLINGDFKINQRGATSYIQSNTWKYCVDRWRYIGVMNVTVNDDGTVTFTKTDNSNSTYFTQSLETPNYGGNYTLSFEVKEITGLLSVYIEGGSAEIMEITESGTYVIHSNTGGIGVVFRLDGTTTSVTLKWVKLEQGSIATPFNPRLYSEEMLLCQRYYREVLVTGLPVNYYTSDYGYVEASVLLEQKMRAYCKAYFKDADITIGFRCINDTTPSGSVDKDNIIATNQRIILKGTCTKMPISVWTKDSDVLCLDAEIY